MKDTIDAAHRIKERSVPNKVMPFPRTVVSFAVLAAAPALAHHSAAMFDDQIVLQLEGTVTKFDYINPHSWLYVSVTNDDGTTTEWGFELDAPPRLRRIGVSPNFWQPGDAIKVKTNPLKDGRPAGHLVGAVSGEGGRTFGNTADIESAPQ
jgi:hypothetical protein